MCLSAVEGWAELVIFSIFGPSPPLPSTSTSFGPSCIQPCGVLGTLFLPVLIWQRRQHVTSNVEGAGRGKL